jgi:hypothetical protein
MMSYAYNLGCGNGENEKNQDDEHGARRHGFKFYNTRKKLG